MANFPYQAGVGNDLIDEINAVGGDGLSALVPVAKGLVTITAVKATESVTLSATPTVVVAQIDVAGDSAAVTISGTTTGLVTFTRSTTVSAGTIYYVAW